jgi:hypothetical protein
VDVQYLTRLVWVAPGRHELPTVAHGSSLCSQINPLRRVGPDSARFLQRVQPC